MKIVIKIGGSMAFDENGPKIRYLEKLVPILKKIKNKNQLIVSIGGGKFIRKYLKNVKGKISNEEIEWIFVDLLKANVRLLSNLLNMKPIFDLKSVNKKTSGVIGGIMPGRSTDANAAICAEKINADLFIKLTNVSGIYDKDPNKYKRAKKLKKILFSDLNKLKTKTSPGNYGILDPMAIDIIRKNRIRTIIINGKNPKNILDVIHGKNIGTVISD
ncbi:MAG: hypothetical protein QXD48_02010 [Candidatus Aenigmatarchaeota archaeon]